MHGRGKRVLTLPYLVLDAGFGVKYASRLAEAQGTVPSSRIAKGRFSTRRLRPTQIKVSLENI